MTRTVTSAHNLLLLQCHDESQPVLPLSQDDPLAFEQSPLATLRHQGSRSEVVSQLLGPGPWPIRANLHLPADCSVLHPTSRSRESTIHVTHALRFTMRLTRGDAPKTHKPKLFEVVVRTPVHILSVRSQNFYSKYHLSLNLCAPPPVLRTYGVFRVAALLRDARRKRHARAANARVSVWRRARTSCARG